MRVYIFIFGNLVHFAVERRSILRKGEIRPKPKLVLVQLVGCKKNGLAVLNGYAIFQNGSVD